jgi:hypothetical protein
VLTNCNIFKGKTGGSTSGSSGILALPNIRFREDFKHSSLYADETLLDFVVNFYRGDLSVTNDKPVSYTLVTSHLINAYTLNNYPPLNLKISMVNYYMGNTKGNLGWRIPTLLRIKAKLQQEDIL